MSSSGDVRMVPANVTPALPSFAGMRSKSQFSAVDHLSSAPPPSQVCPRAPAGDITAATASAKALRQCPTARRLATPFLLEVVPLIRAAARRPPHFMRSTHLTQVRQEYTAPPATPTKSPSFPCRPRDAKRSPQMHLAPLDLA